MGGNIMNNTTVSGAPSFSTSGIIWLKLAVVYLLAGVGLGIFMGAQQNFTLRPVHAHINLLGWATLALAGLIYTVFPKAAHSRLAKIHFWLLNLALPVMMVALSLFLLSGNEKFIGILAPAEMVAAAGIVVFAVNIFKNLDKS
jgi:heme/copper-type cytochrome/quinol oxidase subunit 1